MSDGDDIDVDNYAGQVVLYLLTQHSKNSTIKKPDLMKTILPDLSRKAIKAIMNEAKKTLKKVHGVDLIELEESVRQYMLVNAIPIEPALSWSDEIRRQKAVLLPVLSYIFMNGGTATEHDVKTLLCKLKITKDIMYESEYFGDVEKMLKSTFVSQRYLCYGTTKLKNDDEAPVTVFTWGMRANHEVSKEKILQFVSDVYGVDVSNWPDQLASINK